MPTEPPTGLPARAYLIAYDVERKKFTGSTRSELVQAAALVQLSLAGLVSDVNGRAVDSGRRTGDPVLDALLERIAGSRPRPWKHWVSSDHKATFRAIRDRLVAERVIAAGERRVLGLIPRRIFTVRDTRIVRRLIADARATVLGGTPVDQLDPGLAALVAMVAAVELNTVFSGRERREHRERIKQLAERSGPAVKALRKAVQERRAAAAAAAGG